MSALPSTQGSTATGGINLRVILLGRTALDQALRLDPSIELLRARMPLDAIGELGRAIADGRGDARSIVVVGTRVVTRDELSKLVSALREVDPLVCVLGLLETPQARADVGDPAEFSLDGWLTPPVSGDLLRLLSTSRSLAAATRTLPRIEPSPVAPEPAVRPQTTDARSSVPPIQVPPAREPEPVAAPVVNRVIPAEAGPKQPASGPVDDTGIAAAMLKGEDVVAAFVSAASIRLGATLRFESGQQQPTLADGEHAAAAMHTAHTFGWLAGRATLDALSREAARLAVWLALREQHSQLRKAAFSDPLTGAWNRRYFDGFLASAIEHARERRHDLTVLLFDVDDFKQFNDKYGHAAGDEILTETVRLMKSVVRPSDKVCRIGGDEFAVIFHEPEGPRVPNSHHPSSVFEIARRFQAQVAQAKFRKLADQAPGALGISGGMATYPWDGHDAASLLEHADALLMESKRQGKNALRFGPGAIRAMHGSQTEPPEAI